jgi:hypothetical protein
MIYLTSPVADEQDYQQQLVSSFEKNVTELFHTSGGKSFPVDDHHDETFYLQHACLEILLTY